jgi:hypothetical protein
VTPVLSSRDDLISRREIARGPLRPLATALRDELGLVESPIVVPRKALLSRDGGRCPVHGTYLEFDPRSTVEHRCLSCNRTYTGELHDRFRPYWHHMWLIERAVHGAVLAALDDDDAPAAVARDILHRYADAYFALPNVDNVLGPTRLFFSTYLEAIWLLHACIALDVLEQMDLDGGIGGAVRDRIITPSAQLIAQYDEGGSNRQVWNNVALAAAGLLTGRDAQVDRAMYGESGILAQLGSALLPDGTWYEGENYHLFAHRGLWYATRIAEANGLDVPAALVDRFRDGYATPFLTALPDLTLPSRRDSQYAVSLRQWRFAELAELGLAERADDDRLRAVLGQLYDPDVPRGDTGRWRSTAEVERNEPPTGLTRADLNWRSLLFALADPPISAGASLSSMHLENQGYAIFRRREGAVYAALDYGHHGGGHGHPDRLNLVLAHDANRWLEDVGTGSYVDPSLHWYRSSLAHNAPLVNGRSQRPTSGVLVAYDEVPEAEAGWIVADAQLDDAARTRRALVVMNDYVVDSVLWRNVGGGFLDLPIHLDAGVEGLRFEAATIDGGAGGQDGFAFVRAAERARLSSGDVVRIAAVRGRDTLRGWLTVSADAELWRMSGPGAPGAPEARFLMVRCASDAGAIRTVWSWSDDITAVDFGAGVDVAHRDGRGHTHTLDDTGWHIDGPHAMRVDLFGLTVADEEGPIAVEDEDPVPPVPEIEPVVLTTDRGVELDLGRDEYRRSELSWEEAGAPHAVVGIDWDGAALAVTIDVAHVDRTFVAAGAVNPYDNEPADINGAGVQLYFVGVDGATTGAVLVPAEGTTVRVRAIDGWGIAAEPDAMWQPTATGYRMTIVLPASVPPGATGIVWLDVIVNEKPEGRERRRGQLVLSGADGGGFVYLRGDRHDPSRLMPLLLQDV